MVTNTSLLYLKKIPDHYVDDLMTRAEETEDAGREITVESVVSALILSIQKLESRIADLEARG